MGVIYSIINPMGQIYVGATKDFKNRMLLHRKDSKKKKKSKFLLYISINKYGWLNHSTSILEEVENDTLRWKEIYWIEKLGACFYKNKNGLNMTLGNHGLSGKHLPALKNIKEKKKLLKRPTDRKIRKQNKKVVAYSLDGKYIGDYISCNEAVRKLGLNDGDAGRVARGTSNCTGEYIFKFHNGIFEFNIDTSNIVIKRKNIPVLQVNENMDIIQEYKSAAEAGKILNICRKKIHRAVQRAGKPNPSGHRFIYKDEFKQVTLN